MEGAEEAVYTMGKSYDQLDIGVEETFTKKIEEKDVIAFAGLTGDHNPIHIDNEFAKKFRFKQRIVHGWFTQSLVSTILGTKLPGLGTIVVEVNCKYLAPVYIGDRVTVKVKLKEKLESKKHVVFDIEWLTQENTLVAVGQTVVIPPLG